MYKTLLVMMIASISLSLTIGELACCPPTYVYDRDTITCVCPLASPYVSASGTCVACNSPSIWNNSTRTCQKCRNDMTENAQGVCVCPTENPFDDGTKCTQCPNNLPVWNGRTCVACPAGTNFDAGSKTCTVCPPGLAYSAVDRRC